MLVLALVLLCLQFLPLLWHLRAFLLDLASFEKFSVAFDVFAATVDIFVDTDT